MEILVILDKNESNIIVASSNEVSLKLKAAALPLSNAINDKNITVSIINGSLDGANNFVKNTIILSSKNATNNLGKYVAEFKRKAIDIMNNYGLTVNSHNLDVRLNQADHTASISKLNFHSMTGENSIRGNDVDNEFDYAQKSKLFIPVEPLYSFDRVILQQRVIEKIRDAVGVIECENKVFKEWGLYEIQPHPSTALSFFGPSGTGKTMAAEAVAQKLGKKILKVSYADVESKYVGEGPKMVKAIFLAAENDDAVLFFDEADSLLSKRLTSVTSGSEQSINSMRSQLLICLEEFKGIVIFATNLVVNYDQAFLTRLISVEFKKPDVKTREKIWNVHIKAPDDGETHQLNIPLSSDVNTEYLAEKYDFVGREVRNAVVSACVSAALSKREEVTQNDFIEACEKIIEEKAALKAANSSDQSKNSNNDIIKKVISSKIREMNKEKENVSEPAES